MASKKTVRKPHMSAFQKQHLNLKPIKPLTKNQLSVFESDKHQVLSGCAGTGKTFITSFLAYQELLKGSDYEKLIYIRSAVPTRNQGFYPGSPEEKEKLYEAPYIDIACELFDRSDAYNLMKIEKSVEFRTTSHVRGITLRKAIIIADECQNMTYHELDSIITRLDNECKIYFCGDFDQADIRDTGIRNFFNVLKTMEEFNFVEFGEEDIVRSGLVKAYLTAKGKLKVDNEGRIK